MDEEDMMEDMMAMMMMGDLMSMGLDDDELEKGFGFGMKMPGMPKQPANKRKDANKSKK